MIHCLPPSPWGGRGYFVQKTSSTMDEALLLEQQGEPEGSYVLAGEQTSGRGRTHDRIWISPPEVNLLFTFFLFPESLAQPSFAFSMTFGLGICFWLEHLGLQPYIKWPNDILLAQGNSIGKVCGLLVNARWQGNHLLSLHCGIGVNLQLPYKHAEMIDYSVTSLDQFGLKISPVQALKDLFPYLYHASILNHPEQEVEKRLLEIKHKLFLTKE